MIAAVLLALLALPVVLFVWVFAGVSTEKGAAIIAARDAAWHAEQAQLDAIYGGEQ